MAVVPASRATVHYYANSLLYVDFIHGLARFGGYGSCLVVTFELSRFTRVFPCNKKITGEQTVKMLVEHLRTSRALWEIGWNTRSLWLTRLGLT